MVHSVSGEIKHKGDNFVILEAGGLGLKIFMYKRALQALPASGNGKLFTHLQMREDGLELYGFAREDELEFFELLISVSGVGPKSALSILEISELKNLQSAIKEERPDLLTRASGIGRKTAERIIVELKSKVKAEKSELTVKSMEADADLVEALVDLGYRREQAKAALAHVEKKILKPEERLKQALKILSGRG